MTGSKILEAKIAQQKDPRYFSKHTILDLRPENIIKELDVQKLGKAGTITVGDKRMLPDDVGKAFEYQLKERKQFVKPPDIVVASLLVDHAALQVRTASLEDAVWTLKQAIEYGYPAAKLHPLIDDYIRRINEAGGVALLREPSFYETYRSVGIYTVVLFVLAAGLFFAFRKYLASRREPKRPQ